MRLIDIKNLSPEPKVYHTFQQGLINLTAAQIELDNFKRHVIPVAEFFDTKQILHLVNILSAEIFCYFILILLSKGYWRPRSRGCIHRF